MERPSSSPYPRRHSVLVVDDNRDLLSTIASALARQPEYEVETQWDPVAALARARERPFDLFLLDVRMPGLDGITLLEQCRRLRPEAATVLMTAYATVEQAVEIMRLGADYYLAKPFSPARLREVVARLLDGGHRLPGDGEEETFLTRDPATASVLERASAAAESDATVLIQGESGTGKELLARWVHARSRRRTGTFEVLNSAAMPETLVEALLFGHERGAFTGAERGAPGKVELAQGGTLFFDEVGDMSLPVQAKVLRVLQDRTVQRLGGRTALQVDVRYVFATNRDLRTLMEERAFREDLFYRIGVVDLFVPPLRQRPDDVRLLAERFLARFARETGRGPASLSPEAWGVFLAERWPGNVRQLQNACWRAVLFAAPGQPLTGEEAAQIVAGTAAPGRAPTPGADGRGELEAAIAASAGNLTRAAARLGISRPTLYARLRKYGIPTRRERT